MKDMRMYEDLIKEHGSPLMLLNSKKVIDNYDILKEALPGVSFYYAIKANNHPHVIKVLKEEGCKFDVASINEIKLCLDNGVKIEDMFYTHPIKTKKDIQESQELGINTFVVDNLWEVSKIPYGAKVLIRAKTYEYECASYLSKKFGCELEEIETIAVALKEAGANVRGVCFHVGSQMSSNQSYVDMIISLKSIYNRLEERGFILDCLDIGGGFPSSWENPVNMIEFCRPIRDSLELFKDYDVWAEPGRYMVNEAFSLLYSIIGKNVRDDKTWYYVDEGIYGSLSTVIYDKFKLSIKPLVQDMGILELCTLAGPTCDSLDIISEEVMLPEDLTIGSILLTEYIGAYSTALATNFNGIEKTKILLI